MKRSVSYYVSRGVSDTRWGFKHIPLSQRLLLLVYGFIGFFGKLFFFSRPFFTLAETNLVTLLSQRKPFNVWQMFDQVVERERYHRLRVSYFVMDLLTLFVASILLLFPFLIWMVFNPMAISFETLVGLYNSLIIYFIVLGFILLLFSFSFYRPFAFVTVHHPNHGSGSILTTTHQLLKKQNKVTVFVLNFAYFIFLYFLGFLITVQGSTVVFGSLVAASGYEGFLATLIVSILLFVAMILLLIWLLPVSYVLLISIQHHLLIDALAPVETGNSLAPIITNESPELATATEDTSSISQPPAVEEVAHDKKVPGKTKRKLR
jgi:MFS family permease